MTAQTTKCPSEPMLRDFGLGKLDAASAETVSLHIETCPDCRQRVAGVSGDSFVDLLREARDAVDMESVYMASTKEQRGPQAEAGRDVQEAAPLTPSDSGEGAAELPPALGRYQVTELLGQGGFGVVYLGHDPELQRSVAIKVPRRDRFSSPADTDAYLAEARLLAALAHPGIVPVYDFGRTADGMCYVVSQYVHGGDLGTVLAHRRLAVAEAVELTARIAEALQHAHEHGLVHRDVKPGNILLDEDGHPLVADFGLALSDASFGRSSGVFGTPAYMSPEQARGESHLVDARSDIYSLGILFYEVLTGRRAYRLTDPIELLEEISNHNIRPPRQLDHTIPQELERICLKALAKSPSERYTTAFDLAVELRRWQSCGETLVGQSTDLPIARSPGVEDTSVINEAVSRRGFKVLIACVGLLTISVTATVAVLARLVIYGSDVHVAAPLPPSGHDRANLPVVGYSKTTPKDIEAPVMPTQPDEPTSPTKALPQPLSLGLDLARALASYRLIVAEDPESGIKYPLSGAVAVADHTLLTTGAPTIELAKIEAKGWRLKATKPSDGTSVAIDGLRIHALFQSQPANRLFFEAALVYTKEPLTDIAELGTDDDLERLDLGRVLTCIASDHDRIPFKGIRKLSLSTHPGIILEPQYLRRVGDVPRALILRGPFQDWYFGNPIINKHGRVVAVYCGPVADDAMDRHFATVVDPEFIQHGLNEPDSPLWAPIAASANPQETTK
jgi:serine/threonine protein kinase